MQKLIYVPDPLLRQKAKKISRVDDSEIRLANKMMDIMIKAPGVGLAANQVGILKQIVTILFIDSDKNKEIKYVLFNPKITKYSQETVIMEEGCLSLPEQFAEIERPKSIEFEYLNEKNELIKRKANGIEARILQHEIDHLSGKLFVDYLSSLKRNIMIKKVQKFLKTKNNER